VKLDQFANSFAKLVEQPLRLVTIGQARHGSLLNPQRPPTGALYAIRKPATSRFSFFRQTY
jgi:hypothetical protein